MEELRGESKNDLQRFDKLDGLRNRLDCNTVETNEKRLFSYEKGELGIVSGLSFFSTNGTNPTQTESRFIDKGKYFCFSWSKKKPGIGFGTEDCSIDGLRSASFFRCCSSAASTSARVSLGSFAFRLCLKLWYSQRPFLFLIQHKNRKRINIRMNTLIGHSALPSVWDAPRQYSPCKQRLERYSSEEDKNIHFFCHYIFFPVGSVQWTISCFSSTI